jgi:phospholipase C
MNRSVRSVATHRLLLTAGSALLLTATLSSQPTAARDHDHDRDDDRTLFATTTPIQHVVVIFQENVSFDHYFATYPHAANPDGEPAFYAKPGTPTVNGLTAALHAHNPNAVNPFRLGRSQAATCDQDHEYTAEQQAFNHGLMDKFVEFTGNGGTGCDSKLVMAYFDGNTVTALWNYAQFFAMSDNSFDTVFGPSTPGALNLVSGQTHGATPAAIPEEVVQGTVISDPQPTFDDCTSREHVAMSGKNVGDLLNAKGITWGFFQGGFAPTSRTPVGKAVCGAVHTGGDGKPKGDYIPHHQPFQYYQSTANPHHLPPSKVSMIGKTDQANHQYDLIDFWHAVDNGNMPAVSYLKAAGYQDGHAGYSDPLAEQTFLVQTINRLQQRPEWAHTAVIIAWDDSDGWYDHVMSPIVMQSSDPADALSGPGSCGVGDPGAYQGRCGYGPRLPLVIVSPYAKRNFVDHTTTDQTSILRFIEDNWSLGRIGDQSFDDLAGSLNGMFDFAHRDGRRLFLDPASGQRLFFEDWFETR